MTSRGRGRRRWLAGLLAALPMAVAALPAPQAVAETPRARCDDAPFPSLAWTQCEARNLVRAGEAPLEQVANPAFLLQWQQQSVTNFQEWTARGADDPSWIDPLTGNTAALPLCATWSEQCTGDPFRYPGVAGPDGAQFYDEEARVQPVVFYDRDCARLSGRVWVPRDGSRAKLPTVVITNGSLQAPQTAYWWAAQELVRQGYVVLNFDPRGQGRSDQKSPDGQLGTNLNSRVFWEGTVDAIDFLHSTPERTYPHERRCAGSYPTRTASINPAWRRVDRRRLGIAGHSLGAIAVSVVQGYGAPGADPWPGLLDRRNPVDAVVGWDSLIGPDLQGFAPSENVLGQEFTQGFLASIADVRFGPRAPALNFSADYGLLPTPYAVPPRRGLHNTVYRAWREAGVPAYSVSIAGTTHFDYSPLPTFPATSWCGPRSTTSCVGGWARPAITRLTLAWFDRWLKEPGERGYRSADRRLVDDDGRHGARKLSWHYRSSRDFPGRDGRRHRCGDIRAGCQR